MSSLTPDSSGNYPGNSSITPCWQASSEPSTSVMPTPPLKSPHTSDTKPFCCDGLYPLTRPLGPHDQAIYHFVYYMVNITSAPSTRIYLPAMHSAVLEESNYVIRLERWMSGEKEDVRYFINHPKHNTAYIEVDPEMLEASSRKNKWIANWRYLKFRCDLHQGPWYTCFVMERRDKEPEQRVEVRAGKRKRTAADKFEDVVEEKLGSEGDAPPYTLSQKSTKRRRV